MSFNSNEICMLHTLEHHCMLSAMMMDISLTKRSKIEEKKMKQIRQHWTDVNVKRSLCHISSLFRCAIVETTWREHEREKNDSRLWQKKREGKMHGWDDLYVAFFLCFLYRQISSFILNAYAHIGKIDMISAFQQWQAKFDFLDLFFFFLVFFSINLM
jgi:hypothetical protein